MSRVVIEKCADYQYENVKEVIKSLFDSLGGIEKYVKKGTKVVLKPNLIMKKRPEEAATTHPTIIQAVSEMVINAGGTVTIADSPGGLYSEKRLKGVYSACGAEKAAKNSGARLNFDLDEVDIPVPGGKYLKRVTVIKPLVDADVIINLPKLKSHGQMIYTGAVKNMFGAVPGALKAEYHLRMPKYEEFADALIDIFLSVKPHINIMDAVVGMEGKGPTAGNPIKTGAILAGENAFELDFAALKIIDANPMDIPIINNAVKRGLCTKDFNTIDLKGEEIEKLKVHDFNLPQVGALKVIEFFDKGILNVLMNSLKPKPVFNHKICVGCSDCAKSCPAGIIVMKDKKPHVDLTKCIRCFCCQELCPAKAVDIKRPAITKLIFKKKKKV